MIALVAAVAENGIIGTDNDLPWHLPDDLNYFRRLTSGKTVVMGRKTYESIRAAIGGPLPNRVNIVLTRDAKYAAEGVTVLHDVRDIASLHDDVYVIGGAQIYAATIVSADVLYITDIHSSVEGDAAFPPIDATQWVEVSRIPHPADEKHQFSFDFVTYHRR